MRDTLVHCLAMCVIILLFLPMVVLTLIFVILDYIGNWYVGLLEEHIG